VVDARDQFVQKRDFGPGGGSCSLCFKHHSLAQVDADVASLAVGPIA